LYCLQTKKAIKNQVVFVFMVGPLGRWLIGWAGWGASLGYWYLLLDRLV
jgi:hypothetical protein